MGGTDKTKKTKLFTVATSKSTNDKSKKTEKQRRHIAAVKAHKEAQVKKRAAEPQLQHFSKSDIKGITKASNAYKAQATLSDEKLERAKARGTHSNIKGGVGFKKGSTNPANSKRIIQAVADDKKATKKTTKKPVTVNTKPIKKETSVKKVVGVTPVKTPVKDSTKTKTPVPTKPVPTKPVPTKTPVKTPVKTPTKTPVKTPVPSKTPVKKVVKTPVKKVVKTPVKTDAEKEAAKKEAIGLQKRKVGRLSRAGFYRKGTENGQKKGDTTDSEETKIARRNYQGMGGYRAKKAFDESSKVTGKKVNNVKVAGVSMPKTPDALGGGAMTQRAPTTTADPTRKAVRKLKRNVRKAARVDKGKAKKADAARKLAKKVRSDKRSNDRLKAFDRQGY